jgi:NAD(P)-dependent dehydrogenase (short-subunit alcohol dehydrogenase family)
MICDKIYVDDLPANIDYVACDVGCKEDFEHAFVVTKEKLGRVDIVVNNAGILKEANYEGEPPIENKK